jgi:hypothetical protein
MTDSEQNEAAARNVLKHAVEHIYASPDLARRVEMKALSRRRKGRWSAAGAVALVAIGTVAGLVAAGNGGASASGSPASAPQSAQAAYCASNGSAYVMTAPPFKTTRPLGAGNPSAALICRFAGDGALAGSRALTDPTELATLLNALNAAKPYSGSMYCLQFPGSAAIVLIYPGDQADLVVDYNPSCAELYTKAGTYLVGGGDIEQLIAGWTGGWRSTPSPTAP